MDRLEESNEDHEKEIEKLVSSLKEKIFELKNPELVEKKKRRKNFYARKNCFCKNKSKRKK